MMSVPSLVYVFQMNIPQALMMLWTFTTMQGKWSSEVLPCECIRQDSANRGQSDHPSVSATPPRNEGTGAAPDHSDEHTVAFAIEVRCHSTVKDVACQVSEVNRFWHLLFGHQ